MTFDNFISKYLGESIDYDGVSGAQCVDFVKLYLDKVFGITPGSWGNAKEYWLNFSNISALSENFKKIKNTADFIPIKGDIVVWSGDVSSSNDYGHIAVASGEGTTSYFYSYDQNWSSKKIKKIKHTYKAVYGVLRAKEITAPDVTLGTYKLTNVRGIYNGVGASTGRKKVSELTANAKKHATSSKSSADAYLKASTAVTVSKTQLAASGNLWGKIPSGWLCIWEKDKNKLFLK